MRLRIFTVKFFSIHCMNGIIQRTMPTMTYKAGDIVLTVFPFSDLTSRKKRPVLIVSSESLHRDRGEYIGLMITSHEARDSWDVMVKDWRQASLLFPSVVRVSKVFGLEEAIITRQLGRMTESDFSGVLERFRRALY
ncbi:type II toxin-antitoxin system PemK/MazF family toxin [Alicyclobacillaceae bacterium I2511]|nr:type II toxin-antitoxin system PemK/MazF family toxin [Alicyclobacillaceae bacterium I2511]